MAMNKNRLRFFGITLFVIGTILFVLIGLFSIWGEVEASFFNAALKSDEPLKGLRCPVFITTNEIGTVSKEFINTSEKTVDLEVRTYISDGYVTLLNEIIREFSLAPGESELVKVPFSADDAAYNRIVMVRMHQMKRFSFPYQNASCGIILINIPFITGTQFLIITIALAVLCSGLGITLWAINAKPIIWDRLNLFKAMIILLATAIIMTITSLLNYWAIAIIIAVIWLLMGVVMIWQFSTTIRKKNVPGDSTPKD